MNSEHDWAGGCTPIFLVGPTAIGKTDVAIELAIRLDGEIINADSMQVYRGMDIGTAKPEAQARRRACFHLLDLVFPNEAFNVSDWKSRAEECIAQIAERGRQPIICGGTGLYIRALTDDWTLAHTPESPEIREALRLEVEQLGSPALHQQLAQIDPESAARLHPNDSFRIVRALEVYRATGIPISVYQARDQQTRRLRRAHRIGLVTARDALYERIEARVDRMIANGFVAEVEALIQQGYGRNIGPMRGLGYKELAAFLSGETDRKTAIEAIKLNTRRFSKRQLTWFRADQQIRWIDVENFSSAKVAAEVQKLIV